MSSRLSESSDDSRSPTFAIFSIKIGDFQIYKSDYFLLLGSGLNLFTTDVIFTLKLYHSEFQTEKNLYTDEPFFSKNNDMNVKL